MADFMKLADSIYHLKLRDAGNERLIQVYVEVEPLKQPLFEKSLRDDTIHTQESVTTYGTLIGWDYGLFPSETTRQILRNNYKL